MQSKQPLDPKDNILQISRKKNAGEFIFISKIFLNKFETIQLHGLGEATTTVAQVAEYLRRNNYVTVEKIETQTFQSDESDKNRGGKKVKLIAHLKTTNEGKQKINEDLQRKQSKE